MNLSLIQRTCSNLNNTSKFVKKFLQYKQFSTKPDEKIIIPKRIQRSPTDILYALESTIDKDPTAAHYKYHDDPYLIPMSNIGKRTFAMSQEAGRKAAQWIRREHADLFQHKECDPPIESFFPPMVYNETSEVTEQDLIKLIKHAQLSDAKLVYKLLKEKNIEISDQTQQALLELFCYQNSEDVLSEDFIEERWFRLSLKAKERHRKTWKDGDMAEELFISIKNPTTEAYCAIIQGMCKYHQVERAWKLYEESQEKGLILNTNTYNYLISISNFLREDYELKWNLVTNLLSDMQKSQLKPNLGTLNSVLHILSLLGTSRNTKQLTLKTLVEFKGLNIEPSLGSWYLVLNIFCKERGPVSTILYDIMNEVENKEHKIRDLKDTNFFVTAMDVCRNHLHDIDLAKRVHNLLSFGNNYDLIGDSYRESIYFRHYLVLLVNSVPFDEFMNNFYLKTVPHVYVPEPRVMFEILNQVEISGAIEFIPKLWSDIIIFDHWNNENVVEILLNIMVNNQKGAVLEMTEKFAKVAWELHERIENQLETRTDRFKPNGDMLGKIMMLLLLNKEFEKADKIMEKLDRQHQTIVGVPKIEALSLYVDCCIEQKMPSKAINCIQYCSDSGYAEAKSLAARLNEQMTLDENLVMRLTKIVGDFKLKTK